LVRGGEVREQGPHRWRRGDDIPVNKRVSAMTAEQCANRQADHENLIQQLTNLLRDAHDDRAVRAIMGDFWCVEVSQALRKVDGDA
jgi:hypothetical protein